MNAKRPTGASLDIELPWDLSGNLKFGALVRSEFMSKLLKNIGIGFLVLIVAAVGVYLGMSFRSMQASQNGEFLTTQGPTSKLQVGMVFPDLELMASDSGRVRTSDFVANDGSVFIFMQTDCPPCESMTAKWQTLINNGEIERDQVLGITIEPPQHVTKYAQKHGLTFPIYADTAMAFLKSYDVSDYPLVVIVGKSGKIKMYTFDSRVSFEADELKMGLAD